MSSTNPNTPVVSRIHLSKDSGAFLVLGTSAMAMLLETSPRVAFTYCVCQVVPPAEPKLLR